MVRLVSLLTFPGRITERRTPLNDFEFFLISDKVLMFLARFASYVSSSKFVSFSRPNYSFLNK